MALKTRSILAVLAVGGMVAACQGNMGRDQLVREPACEDIRLDIYFEPDSADLGAEAKTLLREAAGQVTTACEVNRVEVLGLADAPGTSEVNLALSARRAQAVRDGLAASGLPAGEFDLQALGAQGAVTAGGQVEPMRRRVDLTHRLSPAR